MWWVKLVQWAQPPLMVPNLPSWWNDGPNLPSWWNDAGPTSPHCEMMRAQPPLMVKWCGPNHPSWWNDAVMQDEKNGNPHI